jgi:hypothetical protein
MRRCGLWFLALEAAFVGGWAAFAPQSWFQSFPGFGRHWLPVLGSYNEHLARDVGTLYLGLMVLSLGAAFRVGDDYLVRLTAASWTVFNALHLIYHLDHLSMYTGVDWWGNLISLAFNLLVGMMLLLPTRAGPGRPAVEDSDRLPRARVIGR